MPKHQKAWLCAVTLEQYEMLVTNERETVPRDGADQERNTCTFPLVQDGHDHGATPGPKKAGASRGPITGSHVVLQT